MSILRSIQYGIKFYTKASRRIFFRGTFLCKFFPNKMILKIWKNKNSIENKMPRFSMMMPRLMQTRNENWICVKCMEECHVSMVRALTVLNDNCNEHKYVLVFRTMQSTKQRWAYVGQIEIRWMYQLKKNRQNSVINRNWLNSK